MVAPKKTKEISKILASSNLQKYIDLSLTDHIFQGGCPAIVFFDFIRPSSAAFYHSARMPDEKTIVVDIITGDKRFLIQATAAMAWGMTNSFYAKGISIKVAQLEEQAQKESKVFNFA